MRRLTVYALLERGGFLCEIRRRDGSSQDGQYYVLEAGDKGEIGIWWRDSDHWVDLLPSQPSDAVQTGTAPNELTVRAVGDTLSLSINSRLLARTRPLTSGG